MDFVVRFDLMKASNYLIYTYYLIYHKITLTETDLCNYRVFTNLHNVAYFYNYQR